MVTDGDGAQAAAVEAARAALQGYLDARFAYEEGASLRHRVVRRAGGTPTPEEIEAETARRLEEWDEIVRRYCTDRTRVHSTRGGYRRIPDGVTASETIASVARVSARRIELDVDLAHGVGRGRRRYVMVLRTGSWLVDSVKSAMSGDDFSNDLL